MVANNSLNKSEDREGMRNTRAYDSEIYYRWLILILVFLIFILGNGADTRLGFLVTFAVGAAYNALISFLISHGDKGYRKYALVISFFDILLLCAFVYYTGGIASEVFAILLFYMGYCSIIGNKSSNFAEGLFCVITYSVVCILHSVRFDIQMNYLWLIIRVILLTMSIRLMYKIICEVKKYDELHKKEFVMARTDKLTGLANRHYFDQKLNEEVYYADCTGNPLNVLIFDIDNFKKFNDTYGHTWGDKLLTLFSDIIKKNIRRSDIPVRYGGEEFLILLRDIDIFTARNVGDRIRRQLERERIMLERDGENKQVTVSCGIAQYPRHSSDIRKVVEFADQALYHAKARGKNIVVSYDEVIEKSFV